MFKPRFIKPLNGPYAVTGKVAKIIVLYELVRLISEGDNVQVLDVGCAGVTPLQSWEALLDKYSFYLTGEKRCAAFVVG
jgi:hypothetical protein